MLHQQVVQNRLDRRFRGAVRQCARRIRIVVFIGVDQAAPGAQGLHRRPFAATGVGRAVEEELERRAQQAGDVVAAFGVAAVPEQILDHARRQARVAADQVGAGDRLVRQRRGGLHRSALHPGVLAGAPALHGDDAGVRAGRHPGQGARHDDIAVRRGAREHAQADRRGIEPSHRACRARIVAPDRRLRDAHGFLRHVIARLRPHGVDQRVALFCIKILPEDRRQPKLRKRRLDDELVDVGDDFLQRGRLAAPPGRNRRHAQRLAQEPPAQRRQIAQ